MELKLVWSNAKWIDKCKKMTGEKMRGEKKESEYPVGIKFAHGSQWHTVGYLWHFHTLIHDFIQ